MKKILLILHLSVILIIFSDNIVFFQFIKTNSNYIKDRISSVKFLKKLTSTIIRDIEYRKPEISEDQNCSEDIKNTDKIIDTIGEKRTQLQKTFFDHYRNSENNLSNTILLADIIHEFMESKIDTLLLPFVGDVKYCYNIMDTEWCQFQSIDIFVFPIIVNLSHYNPELSINDYHLLKKLTYLTFCGSNGVLFNLLFDNNDDSKKTYYLFVYKNEAFISTKNLISSG